MSKRGVVVIGTVYHLFKSTRTDDDADLYTYSLSLFNILSNTQCYLELKSRADINSLLDIIKSSEKLTKCILENTFMQEEDFFSIDFNSKTYYVSLKPLVDQDMSARCHMAVLDEPPTSQKKSQDQADTNNFRLTMKLLGKVILNSLPRFALFE